MRKVLVLIMNVAFYAKSKRSLPLPALFIPHSFSPSATETEAHTFYNSSLFSEYNIRLKQNF